MTDERKAFEAWVEEFWDETPVRHPTKTYEDFPVYAMWQAWQARAAQQSQDREDALRYRCLRNRASDDGICVVHIDYWSDEYRGQAHCEVYDGEFLDRSIDQARRIEGDGE